MPSRPLDAGAACLECRRRKTKCDAAKPVCSKCAKLSKSCRYDEPKRRQSVVRLADKINKLEAKLDSYTIETLSSHGHEEVAMKKEDPVPMDSLYKEDFLPLFPTSIPSGSSALLDGTVSESGYGWRVARAIAEKLLCDWNAEVEMPPRLKDCLIRVFLPFRANFYFFMDVHSFLSRIHLTPSDPNALHPALLNVVYLAACSLGGGAMNRLEPHFLALTREHLQQSLAFVDRRPHFMWASVVLTSYYGRKGRLLEGSNVIGALATLALAYKVHEIALKAGFSSPTSSENPSNAEIPEEARLWYAIYASDSAVSFNTGLPCNIPQPIVTEMEDLLFKPQDSVAITDHNHVVLLGKMTLLLMSIRQCVNGLQAHGKSQTVLFWNKKFSVLETVLAHFIRTLPPIEDVRGLYPDELVHPVNPHMFRLHIGAHMCTIILYNCVLQEVPRAYEKVLNAALAMSAVVKRVRGSQPLPSIFTCLHFMTHICTGCEILVREMTRSDESPSPSDRVARYAIAESGLEPLLDVLLDMTYMFPQWRGSLRKIRALLLSNELYNGV